MKREFIHSKPFSDSWKRMGLGDAELRALENELLKNPQCGDVIPNLNGARKIRFQLQKGKSGGGRAIYIDIYEKEHIYLLFAYPKNVQGNLTPQQEKILKRMIDFIKESD